MTTKIIHVAVGILVKPNGEYLLASRPQGKGWAGWWEFPGGKIEAGEAPEQALSRELHEELGITPTQTQQWLTRKYDYPQTHDSAAKTVLLHFYFVQAWVGELRAKEGQQLAWQHPQNTSVSPILPANAPIMKALSLPPVYAISNVAEMGEAAFLTALENRLEQGLRLIQVREKQLNEVELTGLVSKVLALAKPFGAKVLLNHHLDLALKLGAHGVHLSSQAAQSLVEKPANLPESFLLAASCHNAAELGHAQRLGCDFAVLSPVLPTLSHVGAPTLGWDAFASLIKHYEIPVYALGGMSRGDIAKALSCGARGVAMLRGAWV